ncbi:hypothetical protein IAS59_006612 [Cryptococcus gattii]
MLTLLPISLLITQALQAGATVYPLIESWHGEGFFDGFRFPSETYDNTTNVWPAFWTQGPSWPAGGEIDIIEGINLQPTNMIALHTSGNTSCTIPTTFTPSFSGRVSYPNCDNSQNFGSGCTVYDLNTNSFGQAFAEAGGGVFVAEFAEDGIRVWFMTRSAIPSTVRVNATQIDTSTLGIPVAEYPSSSCDITNLFGPQTLTINIALCGDYAGLPSELARTCPALVGDATCYTTYVINNASTTYAQAYFEINYINVYSSNPSTVTTISPSGPTPTSATSTSTSTSASHSMVEREGQSENRC